ncbi:MAG: RibD family protein [Pseudomonadota bacterium]
MSEALYETLGQGAWTLGHLGQSLDGFIATRGGQSHYVTGPENIRHLHRMRALADAVVVGAETVARDDPRLTVRQVTGTNPLRVILDPKRRLDADHRVFQDGAAPSLVIAAVPGAATHGQAEVLEVAADQGVLRLGALKQALAARGLSRIFVEGGGITVSHFLTQGQLDVLQIAVAPLIIGGGRPGLRLPPVDHLDRALRPPCRIFAMGADTLFHMDLRPEGEQIQMSDQTP